MTILSQNFNGTFAMRRLGTVLDPFIPISESRQIENNRLSLTEIPDSFNRVIVTSDDGKLWYELPIGIPTENQYVVDYNEGFIDFHSSNNLLTVNCQYLGTGWHLINSSRIIISPANPDTIVVQTLEEFISDITNRVNNIVSDTGDSNTEIVDARYSTSSAVAYPTLKSRLDSDFINKQGDNILSGSLIFGSKFKLVYNSDQDSLDIEII